MFNRENITQAKIDFAEKRYCVIDNVLENEYIQALYKAVPDFIDLHYNNFHWFTFNVADIFITIGIIIFILKIFFIENK